MFRLMGRKKISGKDLVKMGYPQGRAIGNAINAVYRHFRESGDEEIHTLLKAVLDDPKAYVDDPVWGLTAQALLPSEKKGKAHKLVPGKIDFPIYGAAEIDEGAIDQMDTAMRLPVTVAGALMPDAHPGYGLPIGGVLATDHAVIPYGVGVDIGCRMALSVFDLPASYLVSHRAHLEQILLKNTSFGAGRGFSKQERANHAVLDNPLFSEDTLIRSLKDKAWEQLGSSGGGNHFAEFGIIDFVDADPALGMDKGRYLAL